MDIGWSKHAIVHKIYGAYDKAAVAAPTTLPNSNVVTFRKVSSDTSIKLKHHLLEVVKHLCEGTCLLYM